MDVNLWNFYEIFDMEMKWFINFCGYYTILVHHNGSYNLVHCVNLISWNNEYNGYERETMTNM